MTPISKNVIINVIKIKSRGDNLAVSKAQQKAVAKYIKNSYDEIKIRIPKGEKVIIQNHATLKNESLNKFIKRAIDETMERDTKDGE